MQDSNIQISEDKIFRLKRVLHDTKLSHLFALAQEYNCEIPDQIKGIHSIVDSLVEGLSNEAKEQILSDYGDAGRVSTYLYRSSKSTPKIQEIYSRLKNTLKFEQVSQFLEDTPYYDEVEIDQISQSVKVRFHYLKGIFYSLDRTGRREEHRNIHYGVAVVRPERKILEVRVNHKSMAEKMAIRIPAYTGCSPFFKISLMSEKLIREFVNWVSSLNSATIQLPISDVAGSLRITAKKGMDLKTSNKYNRELREGRLRSGHVTIKKSKKQKINFRIFFRDCHLTFTLFTCEKDIEYIINAIEKIVEGQTFVRRSRLLSEYFAKAVQ
jgi:hypothetical protein